MEFINNINPILLDLGSLQIRWYGLFFATGILLAYLFLYRLFRKNNYPVADLDSLVVYLFVGLVLGARLGHIVFYNLDYYLANPLEVLMIWKGGLASHGAAIGLFLAYWLWSYVKKVPFSKYVSIISMSIPIPAFFVRIGNFFNSEIIGKPTGTDYGVVFAKLGEDFPRHPVQLYEAGYALVIFLVLYAVYKKAYGKKPPMFIFFLFLGLYFAARFIVEYWKKRHILPESFPLSMGQMLSIIPVLLSAAYFLKYYLVKSQVFPRVRKDKK